jgi:hypothetical protein
MQLVLQFICHKTCHIYHFYSFPAAKFCPNEEIEAIGKTWRHMYDRTTGTRNWSFKLLHCFARHFFNMWKWSNETLVNEMVLQGQAPYIGCVHLNVLLKTCKLRVLWCNWCILPSAIMGKQLMLLNICSVKMLRCMKNSIFSAYQYHVINRQIPTITMVHDCLFMVGVCLWILIWCIVLLYTYRQELLVRCPYIENKKLDTVSRWGISFKIIVSNFVTICLKMKEP